MIAVGSRMPEWVREAYDDYITRLGAAAESRADGNRAGLPHRRPHAARVRSKPKAQRLLAALRKDEYVVALDEHGTEMTTRELAAGWDAHAGAAATSRS